MKIGLRAPSGVLLILGAVNQHVDTGLLVICVFFGLVLCISGALYD